MYPAIGTRGGIGARPAIGGPIVSARFVQLYGTFNTYETLNDPTGPAPGVPSRLSRVI